MHLFDYLKHLIAARSLFSRKAFSSRREEKRGRAKGDYFPEIITFITELQSYQMMKKSKPIIAFLQQ